MTVNLIDVAFDWLGGGAGLPKFCLPFATPPPRGFRFGDPDGAGVRDSLQLQPRAGDALAAPTNALLWHVPALTGDPPEVVRAWPRLKRLDGTPFGAAQLAEDDALLEVWPSVFRRLEYIVSSLDIPAGLTDADLPQMPVPRWFWIRGVGGMVTRAAQLAAAQFTGLPAPALTRFFAGELPLYVAAGDVLVVSDGDAPIEIRAFDALGLPVDPDWVFAMFEALAADGNFARLRVEWPGGALPWDAPPRQLIAVCDGAGKPYESRVDPDAPADPSLPPPLPPLRELALPGTPAEPLAIPASGLVIVEAGDPAYGALADQRVQLELPGLHQRISLVPHGTLAKRPRASFGAHSFVRLQVTDFARWFPRSPNPRNETAGDDAFQRYSDGNEVIPLIDGQTMLREVYRAMRATHAVEHYASDDHIPAFDPAATITAPDPARQARAQILLNNAWIHPDASLLGRRAMLAAPRTQPTEPPDLATVVAGLRLVGALSPSGLPDVAAGAGTALADRRLWWLVSTTPLPPGAYLEVRQLTYLDQIRGDDPRLPGTELGVDIFGITGPLAGGTGGGFASTDGRVVVPALFKPGELPRANVRIVTWQADAGDPDPLSRATSGKGTKRIHASGEVTLPMPAAPTTPPVIARTGVVPGAAMRLELDLAHPGRAVVVLAAGLLTEAVLVIVVNARTGELRSAMGPNPAELRIPIDGLALRDRILVGFPLGFDAVPEDCSAFVMLEISEAEVEAGAATGHPTELLGALREAINAGIDTRVMAWHAVEVTAQQRIFGTTGVVSNVNSGSPRGQAIFDSLVRRELGVHHQKGAFIRTATIADAERGGAMAFVGGIDLMLARWDTHAHDALEPDRTQGPWHDIHCRVRGRAAWDVYRNYRQRWNAALEHPELVGTDPGRAPLPPISSPLVGDHIEDDPEVTWQDGDCTVQINRTLAPHLAVYQGFLDPQLGDLSIRNAFRRAIAEARRFLYIEDQYFWNREIAQLIHDALFERRIDFVILLLPQRLDEAPIADLVLYAQRRRALNLVLRGATEVTATTDPAHDMRSRVVIMNIQNDADDPVYVHCKVIVADDVWMSISSSNLSRRSMTYDSEIGAMSIDRRTRRGGQRVAREFRVDLLAAHLGLTADERSLIDDPYDAFTLIQDYLAGRWRGRNATRIMAMDLEHTHYGHQPDDVDGTFIDAVDALADPDGERLELPIGLVDRNALMEALDGAVDATSLGGLGTLRITFNAGNLPPGPLVVTVSMLEGTNESARVVLGQFPATATPAAGLLRIGTTYHLRAVAALAATPDVPVRTVDRDILPTTATTDVALF